ncbi:MAG: acyl-CoA dehydrogenase [Deltaproteobacteria bacterium]|nr:acyl-CoA dehydrogenase [Deltaproteobacteria bacterium]
MAEFRFDKRDVEFVLFEQLKLDEMCKLDKFKEHDAETFKSTFGTVFDFAREKLWPINAESDRIGAKFEAGNVTVPECQKKVYRSYCENGFVAISNSPEWGGMGLPELLATACNEALSAACMAFNLTPMLTRGAAHIIENHGADWMKKLYVGKMYTGEWCGTMCLTEPQAGSDLAAVKTKAKRDGDGFLIEGTKIFISSGEHDFAPQIVHPVLARIEGAPSGIKGISLFLVPKFLPGADGAPGERNDVQCGNIEHKMGIKSSPTCTLNFGENGRCRGWLIGQENSGIVYMFQMMNEARLDVGLQGLAVAGAAYMQALAYSQERVQGLSLKGAPREPGAKPLTIICHPDIRRMLLGMKAQVEGMRALIYHTARNIDLAHHHPDPEERMRRDGLVQLLTPICKAYCTDMGFRVTEDAIQVHGGYGYCQEYPAEQFCRDIKICSIYEGANGIQALDLVGRKLTMAGGALFKAYVGELAAFIDAQSAHPLIGGPAKRLAQSCDRLVKCTMAVGKALQENDQHYAFLVSTPYLRMFGDVACAALLLEQAVTAAAKLGPGDMASFKAKAEADENARFYYDKLCAAQFFVHNHLPRSDAYADTILSGDRSALEAQFPQLV